MKILEERKPAKQKFIRNMYIKEIQKLKNEEIKKNSSEIEKRNFSRVFIVILASNSTSKEIIIIKTKTKTLFILMKSSYPTYHNKKIEE